MNALLLPVLDGKTVKIHQNATSDNLNSLQLKQLTTSFRTTSIFSAVFVIACHIIMYTVEVVKNDKKWFEK